MDLGQIGQLVEERRTLQARIDQITADLKAVREMIDLRSTTGRPVKPRKKRTASASNGGTPGDEQPSVVAPSPDVGPGDTFSLPLDAV